MTFETIFQEQVRKTKLLITEDCISRISTPRLNSFDYEECKKIEALHKNLLETSMTKNDSNEVGYLVNLNDWSYEISLGGEKGITIRNNPEAMKLLVTAPARSLLFLHNHPRNSFFSERDLNSFLTADAILMATVVCNNGRTYYLLKNVDYNTAEALKYYDDLFEDERVKHTVKEFLRSCKKVGLSFYYGGNRYGQRI